MKSIENDFLSTISPFEIIRKENNVNVILCPLSSVDPIKS